MHSLLGMAAIGWRVDDDPKKVWGGRAVMIALHLGLLYILLWRR